MTERNELREQCKKNERWMEDSEKEHKKVFNELLNTFNVQSEKLKKVIEVECKWQDKYNELQECYHRTAKDLKTSKSNENRLQCLFEECEKERKCVEKELSCTKVTNSLFKIIGIMFNFKCLLQMFEKFILHIKCVLFAMYPHF